MLSKNTVKFIKSLHQKKYRNLHGKFLVEGEKSVLEVLKSNFFVESLVGTQQFYQTHFEGLRNFQGNRFEVTQNQLETLGTFKSNKDALVVVDMPKSSSIQLDPNQLILALDNVKDPGNLGTIIRIADWYGIKNLLISEESAEIFNPRVIQSTMGSFTRIRWEYCDLRKKLSDYDGLIYGALLYGDNLHGRSLAKPGVLVMGNESRGISDEIESLVSDRITIPSFGQAESLNVAIATAVILDSFKRDLSG